MTNNLVIGLLAALVSTNQPAAVSNLVTQATGLTVNIPDANDPVEKEYEKLVADDNQVLDDVDKMIRENEQMSAKGGGMTPQALSTHIREKLDAIKLRYQDFLKRNPNHVRGHLAYGSFLNDSKDEEGAVVEFEKARAIDPKNPTSWNQLANYYGHRGPILKAFEYYEMAIKLDPTESVYYENLATCVYLFRKDSKEYYHLDEQQIFTKALGLYQKALSLDPNNFELAQNIAETYYGIKPVRTDDALKAWTATLNLADSDLKREGVYIHLARFNMNADRYPVARQLLEHVTNETLMVLKTRVLRNLTEQEAKFKATNNAATNAAAK